ncbi:MAG TPA: hypothetical protein VK698_26530 [Kofleriaceae bacterium]|nr:hypothetical protein [Kofleriaceae bacterium]
MKTTRRSGLVLGLALVALTGCSSTEAEAELDSLAAGPPQPPSWNPHPIDPRLCHNQEGPPSKPPEPGGYCDIEVSLTEATFSGQGISEGKGDIRGLFYANPTDVPAGSEETVAVSPGQDYSAGQSENLGLDMGTYRVAIGDMRQVEICASFAEDDHGGANGGDDFSQPCTTITLSCDAQTGQPSFEDQLGPEDFCEADGSCNGSMEATISVKATDADMDEIPNEKDFTPEPCDEELKGTGGIAALIYFHYDDNGLITLGQSIWTNLSQVYGAYDYVVLVADNASSNPLDTSGAAWGNADRVFPPTRAGLLDAMQHLTSLHYRFDTFIHAHGYKRTADDSQFEAMKGPDYVPNSPYYISGQWLAFATGEDDIGTALGGIPIVAWWSTTCIAERQIDTWRDLGAVTTSGAKDVQFRPNAWGNFADNWIGGQTYQTAVDDSETPLVIAEAETLINIEGSLPPWLCTDANSVLGLNACADDFFNDDDGMSGTADDAAYNIYEVYDHSLSGSENMAISSERTFLGDTQITFGAPTHTWP